MQDFQDIEKKDQEVESETEENAVTGLDLDAKEPVGDRLDQSEWLTAKG